MFHRKKPSLSHAPAMGRAAGGLIEQQIQQIGGDLFERAKRARKGLFAGQFWSDKLIDWAMRDAAFKVQLFRFVDVFPMLTTPQHMHDVLTDYLSQPDVTLPSGMGLGLRAGGLMKGAMAKTIAGRITAMAQRFIAGVDPQSALPQLRQRWDAGVGFSVDLLGEACVSEAEAEAYRQRYLALVSELPEQVNLWPGNPAIDQDHLGPIPRTNVSIKISALAAKVDPIDCDGAIERVIESITPILDEARRRNVLVNFDIEQFAMKDLTYELFMRCCERVDFTAGLAMQTYLRSGDEDAKKIIAWTKRTGRQVTVRLVKGAYWDYETIHAQQMGWPTPVWNQKQDTDACFERMTALFAEAAPRDQNQGGVKLALGSHNLRSIAHAMAQLQRRNLPMSALELQMLQGMGDEYKAVLIDQGLRVREYIPVGEMIPGMAYLVRRLLENTSNQSWLRLGSSEDVEASVLLAAPKPIETASNATYDHAFEARHHALSPAVEGLADGLPFNNEPMRDFSDADQRQAFAKAIDAAVVPVVANDADENDAERALATAAAALDDWRDENPRKRAQVLIDAAAIMRQRRDELSAVMIKEAGKTWREADGDVCEAIDFCEFYARCAVKLFEPQRLGEYLGELDEQWHQARGVAVVISPWNFPLAICTGMTVAALVTGNPTIVKPAGPTPGIAKLMVDICHQAGAPREVLQFIAGPGRTVGAKLVRDPRTAILAFTGSKQVGLELLEVAGQTPAEQFHVKKVICEMGGKNAIIIDDSADLDEAVQGVLHSAFGYSGQKCSACSRAIVLESVHDTFLRRLVEATRSLKVDDPADPGTDVGPVIDLKAATNIRQYIEIGKQEGKLEIGSPSSAELEQQIGKPYVMPHIFSGIEPSHRLAREEIFGPVLAVIKAKTFEQALRFANMSEYKLTGAVFSRTPAHLQWARRAFRVGNLYLNRGGTGALVGRQPFGGFGMSGVGTKAGGEDYLLNFVEPRACCENTLRHGFAPGLVN